MTIVIPDVHQNLNFVKTILFENPDAEKYIFLGDWFDSHKKNGEISSFKKTCTFLKHLVLEHPLKDRFVFLVGNHDMCYIAHNNKSGKTSIGSKIIPYWCSGATNSKISTFRRNFWDCQLYDDFFIKNFKVIYKENNFIFSHAGLDISKIPYGSTIENFIEDVAKSAWENFRDFTWKYNYVISDIGVCRGGWANCGGLLWLDYYREFNASGNIGKQIFGHTSGSEPRVELQGTTGESWCIDCNQQYYIKIENGVVETVKV
jgi:hypothetical protein